MRFDRSKKYDGMDELAGMTLSDFHKDAAIFFAGTPGRETAQGVRVVTSNNSYLIVGGVL